MELLKAIQDSGFGVFMRESMWALFGALIVHTFTMGFMVGIAAVMALRTFGLMREIPHERLFRLFAIMQWAGIFAILSGLALVCAYPAKALTNPVFYVKLGMAIIAFGLTYALARSRRLDGRAKVFAALIVILWPLTLIAGKFLAYTHHILMVY